MLFIVFSEEGKMLRNFRYYNQKDLQKENSFLFQWSITSKKKRIRYLFKIQPEVFLSSKIFIFWTKNHGRTKIFDFCPNKKRFFVLSKSLRAGFWTYKIRKESSFSNPLWYNCIFFRNIKRCEEVAKVIFKDN